MARPRDELDMDVDRFEAMIDKSDPEQAALLAQIKEQTSRLRQARGNWNKPSAHRNWNSAKPPAETKPPLEDDSYRWACGLRAR